MTRGWVWLRVKVLIIFEACFNPWRHSCNETSEILFFSLCCKWQRAGCGWKQRCLVILIFKAWPHSHNRNLPNPRLGGGLGGILEQGYLFLKHVMYKVMELTLSCMGARNDCLSNDDWSLNEPCLNSPLVFKRWKYVWYAMNESQLCIKRKESTVFGTECIQCG